MIEHLTRKPRTLSLIPQISHAGAGCGEHHGEHVLVISGLERGRQEDPGANLSSESGRSLVSEVGGVPFLLLVFN